MVDLRGPERMPTDLMGGVARVWTCASAYTTHQFRQDGEGPIIFLGGPRELTTDEVAKVESNECPLSGHPEQPGEDSN